MCFIASAEEHSDWSHSMRYYEE